MTEVGRLGALVLVAAAPLVAFAAGGCTFWDGGPDATGASALPPSLVCPLGVLSVSPPTAVAAPSASGGPAVTFAGTTSGCPVYGVQLFGAVAASSAGPSFASWTASVPMATFEPQGGAGGAETQTQTSASCAAGTYPVPVEVLVTVDGGASGWVNEGTPCVPVPAGSVSSPASTAGP
jgi:hypothetical protein